MARTNTPSRTVSALLAAVLTVLVSAATWAVVDDYVLRDTLPKGATVAGVDVGELPRADAARVIEASVKAPLLSPITVTFRGAPASVDPASLTAIDVEDVLDRAAAPKTTATLPQRVWWRIAGEPYGRETADVITVDAAKVGEWVASEKNRFSIPAVDATVSVSGSKLSIKPAQPGISFDTTRAATDLTAALLAGTKSVALVETTTTPKVTDKKLGKTIFVSTSRKTLTLYSGAKIEKSYRCAVGTPGYPTPLGWFKIVQKRYLPTWRNPGSDWAVDMPAYIGPGPGNPLGTRALNLNAPGIRIHGTSKDSSIGTAASHGCMRMHMWDIEDLYPRVPLGTRVIIVS